MNALWQFMALDDPNVRWVIVGCILIGAGASVVGCFSFLRNQSLVGDAVAHSILPGVAVGYLLAGQKDPLILLLGACISGWLSIVAMDVIRNRSSIKPDTAIAIVLSTFFAVGMMLLSHIQNDPAGQHAGLNNFLFGQAASMLRQDVLVFSLVDLVLILLVILFFPFLKVYAFDKEFAKSSGLPVRFLEFLLATLTVLAVATGIQAVGVVLMAALLIAPAAAARFWTNNLATMVFIAVGFGSVSAVAGSYISLSASAMPTGPWIVVVLSVFAMGSIFMAPGRGMLSRTLTRRKHRSKILTENILKALYHLHEGSPQATGHTYAEISGLREFNPQEFSRGIRALRQRRLVSGTSGRGRIQLTPAGEVQSRRIVRLHRLWELYLSKKANVAADHVHDSAEAMEHILTPEMEEQLQRELNHPKFDPHARPIPGKDAKPPTL